LYNLTRKKDGIKNQSEDIIWIEFDKFGRFKEKYDEPAIGRSLLMSPFNNFFTWMTTPIVEIIDKGTRGCVMNGVVVAYEFKGRAWDPDIVLVFEDGRRFCNENFGYMFRFYL
jgi:hypothetical protein